MSTALAKTQLSTSIAEAVYKEITSRTGRYYYYLGGTIDRESHDVLNLPSEEELSFPVDTEQYERDTRNYMVLVKEIQPSDVAFLIDRRNWTSNVVYDMYDDRIGSEVIGIDLISGGSGYTSNANIIISGGGGIGAAANVYEANGVIVSAELYLPGIGYETTPNVIIQDSAGAGATANAVLAYASSGAQNLQSSSFYVVTDDFNIYKCLDNNGGALSTVKPVEVSVDPFTTSDGYKWKFLCNVPVALRNKFLTSTQIPISTAVRNQFYSSGEIKNVTVTNTGDGYTSATLTIQGDGYLAQDPYYIVQTVINNSGSGYTAANVTIEPPITGVDAWAASTSYSAGKRLQHNFNIYEVINPGTTGVSGPVHTTGTESNGTVGMKYLGTQATANVVVSGGNISAVNLLGSLKEITLDDVGSGYISAPTVTISGGGGANATAYATVLNNVVNKITVTAIGDNYTSAPNVVIGTQWTANSNVSLNSQIFYGLNLYTVSAAGTTNVTAPTHVTGTRTFGTANLTYAGNVASATAVLKYGAGYTRAPNVTITGDGSNAAVIAQVEKSEARISPFIEDGKITRVIVEDGGTGYTYGTVTAVGDGANARFTIDLASGDLSTLQANNELLAVPGAIHAIKVVSGGFGYSAANVTITGDGTGATAVATITNSRISKITIQNPGQNYTKADIVITGDGYGAAARPIYPPSGGHGKNVVSELFARTLGLYTTIGRDRNQGFDVNNDYRQFGIIKEIENFDNNRFFTGVVGSACWVITGAIDTNDYAIDDVLIRSSDDSRFLVVAISTTSALVVSLDGGVPSVGDVMTKTAVSPFTVTGAVAPDVDKYSGRVLYIDNKLAFTSTEEQSVSIKTVLKF